MTRRTLLAAVSAAAVFAGCQSPSPPPDRGTEERVVTENERLKARQQVALAGPGREG